MKKLLFLPLLVVLTSYFSIPVKKSPNIVLIFMDDMGFGDLSCYGGGAFYQFFDCPSRVQCLAGGFADGLLSEPIGFFGRVDANGKSGHCRF
jgi:hypothetical protein